MDGKERGFTGISVFACGVQRGKDRVSSFTELEELSFSLDPHALTFSSVPKVGLQS